MSKHDSLLKILWESGSLKDDEFTEHNEVLLDLKNKDYNYLNDEDPIEPIIITFEALDSFMEWYIPEVGNEVIDKIARGFIVDYITNEINRNKQFLCGSSITEIVLPTTGDFIMVYKISTYTDHEGGHDMDVDCKGIIGEQVKLVYK